MQLGHRVVDEYLEFVAARCRPNTVLAAGFDLKVFFSLVPKDPDEVTTADVLAFITTQRSVGDGKVVRLVDVPDEPDIVDAEPSHLQSLSHATSLAGVASQVGYIDHFG